MDATVNMYATPSFSNPIETAKTGQAIYEQKYRSEYESRFPAQFVAIDVTTEKAFVADHPEKAIKAACAAAPNGIFHLIRIGSAGAFRVSYISDDRGNWLF
jgi:hypothetical protein